MRWRAVGLATLTLASVSGAQGSRVRVVVTDSTGMRIPFAVVVYKDGVPRAANDSGVAIIEVSTTDSVRLVVRRMGFSPSEGFAPAGEGTRDYAVTLHRLPQRLKQVAIRAPQDNRLFRNGFYERMEGSKELSTPARFFTPEELDTRNALRVTQVLESVSFLTVQRTKEVGTNRALPRIIPFITGRGRCAATILLDGNHVRGLYEDYMSDGGGVGLAPATPTPLDDIVSAGSITGIEVYATASSAPSELRVKAVRPTCPLVAIWTGPRQ